MYSYGLIYINRGNVSPEEGHSPFIAFIMEDYDFSLRLKGKFKTNKIRGPRIVLSARRH